MTFPQCCHELLNLLRGSPLVAVMITWKLPNTASVSSRLAMLARNGENIPSVACSTCSTDSHKDKREPPVSENDFKLISQRSLYAARNYFPSSTYFLLSSVPPIRSAMNGNSSLWTRWFHYSRFNSETQIVSRDFDKVSWHEWRWAINILKRSNKAINYKNKLMIFDMWLSNKTYRSFRTDTYKRYSLRSLGIQCLQTKNKMKLAVNLDSKVNEA